MTRAVMMHQNERQNKIHFKIIKNVEYMKLNNKIMKINYIPILEECIKET